MPNTGPNIYLDPSTTAWLDIVTRGKTAVPRPSAFFTSALDDLIKGCKADNNWNYIDRFWIFCTEQRYHATIDITNRFALSEVNSMNWTASIGYFGNGTSSYLNSNFNPGVGGPTSGVNFSTNNAYLGVYNESPGSTGSVGYDISAKSGGGASSEIALGINTSSTTTAGQVTYILNNVVGNTFNGTSSNSGWWSTQRLNSVTQTLYHNGLSFSTRNVASTQTPQVAFGICGQPLNLATYSTRQLSCVVIGGGPLATATFSLAQTSINDYTLYNRIQTFMKKLGINK